MVNKTKVGLFLLLSALFFAFIFVAIITDKYVIAEPMVENVFRLLPDAFWDAELKVFAWGSLIVGLAGSGYTFYLVNALGEDKPRIIRGTRIVDGTVLAKMTKGK
jgi:hypothetical protein